MRTKWAALQCAIVEMNVSAGEVVILARLLDHYNLKTGLCYPSETTLAKKTGYSTRQVRNLLRGLERAACIQTFSRSGCKSNAYHIPILTGKMRCATAEERGRSIGKPTSAKSRNKTKKETGEDLQPGLPLTHHKLSKQPEDKSKTTKLTQQFENRLAEKLGSNGSGWAKVVELAPEITEEPMKLLLAGRISVEEAVKLALKNVKEAEDG